VYNKANFAVIAHSWKNRSGGSSKFKIVKQANMYLLTLAYCWLRARIQGNSWPKFRQALEKAKSPREH
jgi:dolichol-phosphate mannosyltransferase